MEDLKYITELIDYGTENAFLTCNLDDISNKYKKWRLAMPNIKPFYAVKCNANPVILECLVKLGVGFDCATKHEMQAVLDLGASADDIVYANPAKALDHIDYANQNGIYLTTVDSISELEKCSKYYPNSRILIRIKADSKAATYTFGCKYGCDAYTEAPILLKTAKMLGLEVIGVAFHVGTGCTDFSAYHSAIASSRYVFDSATTIGFKFNVLDIGGGFRGERNATIFQVGDVVNKALLEYFPSDDVTVIAEPGTYFVRSAFSLATRIISKKEVDMLGDSEEKRERVSYVYGIDDSIYGTFNRIIFGDYVTPISLKKSDTTFQSKIVGQTFDEHDVIVENTKLPKLEIGDWLTFINMGDYSVSLQTTFHGFPTTPINFFSTETLKYKHLRKSDIPATTNTHYFNSIAN